MNRVLIVIALCAAAIVFWWAAARFVDRRVISKVVIINQTTYSDEYVVHMVYRYLLGNSRNIFNDLGFYVTESVGKVNPNCRVFRIYEK